MYLFLLILLYPLDSLYAAGNYLAVIEEGNRLFEDTTLTLEQRIDIHKKLASSYVAIGSERLAKLDFLEALFLDHDLELDPRLTSPKVMRVYMEAKSSFAFPPTRVPRPERSLPSILVPGIVQRNEGKAKLGNTLLISGIVSVGGIITSHYMYNRTHNLYLDAGSEEEIARRYNEYKTWYNFRGFFISTGVITYLVHLFSLAND